MSCKKLSPSHKSSLTSLNDIHISTTLFEALSNENWRQAMNAEIEALQKNKTWEMVDLPIKKKQWDVSGSILLSIEQMKH